MAFTVDNTTKEAAALPVDGMGKLFILKKTIDFSETANNLVNAGTMGLFDIPADVLVLEVMMHITTADTDVTDVDIGDFTAAGVVVGGADTFVDGATLAATGWVRDVSGETYSPPTGYVGTSAWAIGLTNNDARTINEAVIEFVVYAIDLR